MKITLPSARDGQSIANEKAFCRIYRCALPELCERAEELKEYLLSKFNSTSVIQATCQRIADCFICCDGVCTCDSKDKVVGQFDGVKRDGLPQ